MLFYKTWKITANVVIKVVQEFFTLKEMLPKFITATSIVLIPKLANASDIAEYRPISLCNFIYKILSKIISNRLSTILPNIISLEQSAFVKGRLIVENIALAQELIHELGRKTRGGNVVLKLDMAKAYDRIEWDFMFAVLSKFGFSSAFTDIIKAMVGNC